MSDVPVVIAVLGIGLLFLSGFFGYQSRYVRQWYSRYPSGSLTMQIGVSAVVLACGLYVILTGDYSEATEKWAFATTGTIVGYWLRGSE